jgi:predicted CXXCH cytochrome family protein
MNLRPNIYFLLMAVLTVGFVFSASDAQNKFKLKPGASAKLCLDCHPALTEKLKAKHIHTALKMGDCTECHNPHTSSHAQLLSETARKVCYQCHASMVPEKPMSVHQVVIDGNCVKCHDPHASNYKDHLLKEGNQLCAECHKGLMEGIAKVKFKHTPVDDSCLNCHDPHASSKSAHLLKERIPALCIECHNTDSPNFVRQHMNYPVAKADCSSCHNPHGSNTSGILFDNVHAPVASKRCSQCHEAPTSATPFKTRRESFEVCRGCHGSLVNDALNKNRIHWPVVDKVGCLHCHQPHAAMQKKLLNEDEPTLCWKCHSDTKRWQERLAGKENQEKATSKLKVERGAFTHQPIQEGNCSACHLPHASDNMFLIKQAPIVALCNTCHDWSKHTLHPMGERIVDPRNKNLRIDCMSCHRSHGTGYRYLITYPTVTDLCVQCHRQYKR